MNTTQKTTPKLQIYYVLTLNNYGRYAMVTTPAKFPEDAENEVLRLPDVIAVQAFDNYDSAKNWLIA
jgi:hypothetical protein